MDHQTLRRVRADWENPDLCHDDRIVDSRNRLMLLTDGSNLCIKFLPLFP